MTWKRLAVFDADGFHVPRSFIRIRTYASTPSIQGKSRMQESCPYGSVRGALGSTGVPTATPQ